MLKEINSFSKEFLDYYELQQGIYIVKTISNDTITTYKIKR